MDHQKSYRQMISEGWQDGASAAQWGYDFGICRTHPGLTAIVTHLPDIALETFSR
jgi:hypothetical protein